MLCHALALEQDHHRVAINIWYVRFWYCLSSLFHQWISVQLVSIDIHVCMHVSLCRPKHEEYVPMPNWLTILRWSTYSNSYCTWSYTLLYMFGETNPIKALQNVNMHALHGVAGIYTCAGNEHPLQTRLNLIFPGGGGWGKLHVHVHIGKAWFNSG